MPMMEIMVMVDGGGDDDGNDTISITFIIFQVVYNALFHMILAIALHLLFPLV